MNQSCFTCVVPGLMFVTALSSVTAQTGEPDPGSIDATFQAGSGADDGTVHFLEYLSDPDPESARILVGGDFWSFDGNARRYLAMLDANGSLVPGNEFVAATISGPYFPPSRVDVAKRDDSGRILVGGLFEQVGGMARESIARLNPDGSLDTAFDTGANGRVLDMTILDDDNILVVGEFTRIDGSTVNGIARLNDNGTLNTGFNSGGSGANDSVRTMLRVNVDGNEKILIAGDFTQYNGVARNRLALLHPDGTLAQDAADFSVGLGFNGSVRTLSAGRAGGIYAAGDFTTYRGVPGSEIVRISRNGEHDGSFYPGAINDNVHGITEDSEGRVIIAGDFTAVDGAPRNRIARLSPWGGLDKSFDPGSGADHRIHALAKQDDGKVLIGGSFKNYDGTPSNRIARIFGGGPRLPHNEGGELLYDPGTETFTFFWMGRSGHYYFVQQSEDLENWEWISIVEEGFDETIEYGFASNADRLFLRLIFTYDSKAPVMQTDFNGTRVSTWDEIQLGTDPFEWVDGTGNGLPDAWELHYFCELGVDPDGDPDNDGLTNYEEYLHGTDPTKWDTSGDLLSDGWKIDNGLDPLDPNDNGIPPEATGIVEVEFTIGDPSGSHSEQWRMLIQAEGPDDFRQMGFHNEDFGAIHPETVKLRKGNGYRITVSHVATKLDEPDYDWEAQIDGKPSTTVLASNQTHTGSNRFFVLENHWIVDNTDGLLGNVNQSFGPTDHTVGKEALLIPAGKFRADDGKIHHGFSPPNTEQEEEADVYWASVIQNESNNIVNFIAGSSEVADLLEFHIPSAHEDYVDISPKTFTGAETSLTITGTDAAGDAIYDAEVHVVLKDDTSSEPEPLLILNVMVLPKRGPISVGVYHIEDSGSPDTGFATSPAVAKANSASVVQVLNDVFKQAGVTFELHGSSGDFDVQYDTDELVWDTSHPSLHFWQVAPGSDGRLNSSEQPTIYQDRSWEANIPVFLVKQSGIPYDPFDPDPLFVRAGSSSLSEGQPPQAFVALKDSQGFVELVIAHEIGHVLGLSEANDDGGNHDNPPYPAQVISDLSNLNPPLPPPGHLSEPNAALMQGGSPVDGLLPWPWGRWMSHDDWERANEIAGQYF